MDEELGRKVERKGIIFTREEVAAYFLAEAARLTGEDPAYLEVEICYDKTEGDKPYFVGIKIFHQDIHQPIYMLDQNPNNKGKKL